MNALLELYEICLRHDLRLQDIKAIRIAKADLGSVENVICKICPTDIEIVQSLNFIYNSSYGSVELLGIVLFNNGGWLERHEYDGSEWWEYKKTPLPFNFLNCDLFDSDIMEKLYRED